MNFFGLIFIFIGLIILYFTKNSNKPKRDYSKDSTVLATVLSTHDFSGQRWIVSFTDENGNEVLGMDDCIAGSTFHPENYHIPVKNSEEQVYYWKLDRTKRNYSINGQPIEYFIHFCDETLYDLSKEKKKRSVSGIRIFAILFIIAGLVMFL